MLGWGATCEAILFASEEMAREDFAALHGASIDGAREAGYTHVHTYLEDFSFGNHLVKRHGWKREPGAYYWRNI